MSLTGTTALITGASRGLGLATARTLGRAGAAVACVARPGAELDGAIAGLAAEGIRAIAAPADVTREGELASAIGAAVATLGGLDLLVLNAGGWQGAPLAETSEAMWDQMIDLNLKGAFLALKHASPHLIARGAGTVVAIDSIGGLVGAKGNAAYAASKFGLRGLMEAAAAELRPHRVRVSVLYPHNINSAGRDIAPGSPERDRNLEPADIAELIAFIASAPSHVAIGQVTIWPLQVGITTSFT